MDIGLEANFKLGIHTIVFNYDDMHAKPPVKPIKFKF